MKLLLIKAAIAGMLVYCGSSGAAGSAERGAQIHESCLGCHGTELYTPPRAKIKTFQGLRAEVVRWNRRMNPKLTTQEMDDVVEWLNREYYKF